MFRYFHLIRKKLIEQDKVRTYLLYALGKMCYYGFIWDLRRQVGKLQVSGKAADDASRNRIISEDAFPLFDNEFREYLLRMMYLQLLSAFLTIHYNLKETFQEIDTLA